MLRKQIRYPQKELPASSLTWGQVGHEFGIRVRGEPERSDSDNSTIVVGVRLHTDEDFLGHPLHTFESFRDAWTTHVEDHGVGADRATISDARGDLFSGRLVETAREGRLLVCRFR